MRSVLEHRKPPYVPWSFGFTKEAKEKLQDHLFRGMVADDEQLFEAVGNHILKLGSEIGVFEDAGPGLVRDIFGVVWDRSIDKDIGMVRGCALPEPSLQGYSFPDPLDARFFLDFPGKRPIWDRFRVFQVGFSLWERAWTLRGTENLMMDFYLHPDFVRKLLNFIGDFNIAQVERALTFDIDAVYFGDDWGAQRGLQMGAALARIHSPVLKRMYGMVRSAGKHVMIHSCGDVDELVDDLISFGLSCFNPFQPEVMDVHALLPVPGKAFLPWRPLTQRLPPFGTVENVRRESLRLLEEGRGGNYIFAPAHERGGSVPLENMFTFIECARAQLS